MQSADDIICWSGDMILKSLKFIMKESHFAQIPKSFLTEMSNMKTVLSSNQLKQKLHSCLPYELNCVVLIGDLGRFILQAAFTEILDLDGVINLMPLKVMYTNKDTTNFHHSTRSWLYVFAIKLFEIQKTRDSSLPNCAQYLAIFEADKLAQKISYNYLIRIEQVLVKKIVREVLSSIDKLGSSSTGSAQKLESLTSELFDNRDYYLIPEYLHALNMEKDKIEGTTAVKKLLDCKLLYRKFFKKLTLYHPFNVNSTEGVAEISTIPYTPALKMYAFIHNTCFKRTAFHFLQHKKIPTVSHSDILTVCERIDPLELISLEEYMEMTKNQRSPEYMPTSVINQPLSSNNTMLPLVSPTYQICLPTCHAFIEWVRFFTEDEALDNIPSNRLEEVRAYIKKVLDFFPADKGKTSAVDYRKYLNLVNEWKEKKKEYLKNPVKVSQFPGTLTMEYFREPARFSEHLFPELLTIYFEYFVTVSLPMNKTLKASFKMLALFAEFPQAALIFHNQKSCKLLFHDNCCALDLVLSADIVKPKRCGMQMVDQFVRAIWTKNGIVEGADGGPAIRAAPKMSQKLEKVVEKPAGSVAPKMSPKADEPTSSMSGWKKGFLNNDKTQKKAETPSPSCSTAETQTEKLTTTTIMKEMETLKQSENKLKVKCLNSKNEILGLTRKLEKLGKEMEQLRANEENSKAVKLKLMEEYQRLQEKMKTMEDNEKVHLDQMDILREQINYNMNDRRKLTADNELISRKLADSEAKVIKNEKEHEELKVENENLRNKLVAAKSSTEKYEREIGTLNEEIKALRVESECWKHNYEKVIKNDMMEESLELLGIENPVVYYNRFIQQGMNRLEEARKELRRFVSKSRVRNEKIRAERELIDFEMTVEYLQKKAKMNLDILMLEPNCNMENLLKVEPYPMPFSSFIYSRMDEL